jgi:hypothetical protein
MRDYMKKYRAESVNSRKQSLTNVNHGKPPLAQAEAEAEAEAEEEKTNTDRSRVLIGPVFQTKDGRRWQMTDGQYQSMVNAYPAIDLDAEIHKAAAWNNAAGDKQKTFAGMGRFLNGWLSRQNTKESASQPAPALGPTQEQIDIALGKSNG